MSLTQEPAIKKTLWARILNLAAVQYGLNGLSLLAALGLLILDLYVLLRITVDEDLLVIAAVNNLGLWLLLPSIPFLAIILVIPKGRRIRALLALPVVLALIWTYGVYLLPKPAAAASPSFSIATFNATAEIDDPTLAPLRARAILATNADIIGIQEFDFSSRYIPLLESTYPYHFTPSDLVGTGLDMPYALFSRYPIDPDQFALVGEFSATERAVAARFIVTIDSQPFSIYVMHSVKPETSLNPPSYDGIERHTGTLDVVNAVTGEVNPVIVLCDCNMSDLTGDYAAMANVLHDSWRERGFGFGFTVPATQYRGPFPLFRGDYIWHSAAVQITSIAIGSDNGGSDHYPLIAQVAYP